MRIHQFAVGAIAAVGMIALSQSTASAQVYVQNGPIVVRQPYGGGYYQPSYSNQGYGPRYYGGGQNYGYRNYGYQNSNYGFRNSGYGYGRNYGYGGYNPGFGYNRSYYSQPGFSFGFTFR